MSSLNERHILELLVLPLAIIAVYLTVRFGFTWDIGWEIGELVLLGIVCWIAIAKSLCRTQGRRESLLRRWYAIADRACGLLVWKIHAAFNPNYTDTFYEHLLTLAAKLTIADGVTTSDEAHAVRELLRDRLHLNNDQELRANATFQSAKHSNLTLEDAARSFKRFAGTNRAINESLLELLAPLVRTAEGHSPETLSRLDTIRRILCVDQRDFEHMMNSVPRS